VLVRLSAADRQRVEAAAKASKQNISAWTRGMLMDFKITHDDWNKVMSMFGKARDEYSRRGDQTKAKESDLAISLVQPIMMDLAE
jgi:hypothetical protein